MSFGERMKVCREELRLSRAELAKRLGVSPSAVSNYENGVSFPKEEIILRLFDALETQPNVLFQDSCRATGQTLTRQEAAMLLQYRSLTPQNRATVDTLVETLLAGQRPPEQLSALEKPRMIPLYRTPAAAGYASPVFGEDFDYIPVTAEVPPGAEFAVRIRGNSMEPYLADGALAYVNRDPLLEGDVGIFYVDGDIFCKQYGKDPSGCVHLYSLNRALADADLTLPPSGSQTLVCFGKVILRPLPLPSEHGRRRP